MTTWYSLLGFTWNSIPGEARCGVFLRNKVTYRDHLLLDIFGGWHLSISPFCLFLNLRILLKDFSTVHFLLQFFRLSTEVLGRSLYMTHD